MKVTTQQKWKMVTWHNKNCYYVWIWWRVTLKKDGWWPFCDMSSQPGIWWMKFFDLHRHSETAVTDKDPSNFWFQHHSKLAFSPMMTGTLEETCKLGVGACLWTCVSTISHQASNLNKLRRFWTAHIHLTSVYSRMPTFGAPSASLATDFAMPRDFYIKLDCIVETFDQRWLEIYNRLEAIETLLQVWSCSFSLSPSHWIHNHTSRSPPKPGRNHLAKLEVEWQGTN